MTPATHPLAASIIRWLGLNPGEHRARDIATGLGVPPGFTRDQWRQKVNDELNRMARRGRIAKETRQPAGVSVPVGMFSLPPDPAQTKD